MVSLFVILFFVNVFHNCTIYAFNIPIGGIFEGLDQDQEIAFRVAIDLANQKYGSQGNILSPLIANLEPEAIVDQFKSVVGITWERPYAAIKLACSLLNTGIVAILSPLSEYNADTIQSVCDSKEVPFIRTTYDGENQHECCSINLFPDGKTLSDVFVDLIDAWGWKSFTVLYERDDTFLKIASLIKFYNYTGRTVVMQELKKNEYGNYRTILKNIRNSGQKNFVLHCEMESLNEILKQAQQAGLMMRKYSYIITNLDMHTIDLSPYQHSETNITGLQIVNPLNPKVIEIAKAMQEKKEELGLDFDITNANIAAWKIKTSTALLVDSLMLFAEALKDIGDFNIGPLSCNTTNSWEHGSTIFNYMKMKNINGLTGDIQFDHRGIRNNFDLNVIELKEGGIVKIGMWNPKRGLNISRVHVDVAKDAVQKGLRNSHINVMIAWSDPYALYRNGSAAVTGNDQYEGFVVDLIHEMSLLEGFNYTLIRNPDDKNGDFDEVTKTWNGMIGDILNGTGDIAIGDIIITRQRQEYVDFTTPFMSLGIQILYKIPSTPTPKFFSFADPFAPKVWLLIAISFCVVSLGFYVMARLCPKEWDNWDSCVQNPEFYINQFNLRNSLWYTLGCLLQEGSDVAPRGISTRILSSVWAFFILVIVSYYKAQLAASLTIDNIVLPFNNIEELVERADELGITYGAVENEAVHNFFMKSPIELHQKVAKYMTDHPEYMVEDNYGGYLMIEDQDYAYLTDSLMVQFVSNAVCYLTAIGGPINEQNFAIALRKGSPYRAPLSTAILKLQESGVIGKLQKKWWENDKFKVENCQRDKASAVAPPLNYYHVAGIFWITIGGIVMAYLLVFLELALHILKKGRTNKKLFIEEYKEEVKYNFSFKHTTKPMKDGKIATIFGRNRNKLNESSTENLNN